LLRIPNCDEGWRTRQPCAAARVIYYVRIFRCANTPMRLENSEYLFL